MAYRVVCVENFAGGFACGAVLAGLQISGNLELPGAFGTPMMEANRTFLGDGWQSQEAPAEKWEPVRADIQVSNPPCSAFSGMTAGYSIHGMDSPINDCMWHAIRYAARVCPAVFVMESVAQAFTNGKLLMQRLAQELNEKSGLAYRTTHVLQDNYSLGGVTKRKRYFLVLSQLPFGVELPELKWLPTVGDALSDLRDLPHTWEQQPYGKPPTWWSHHLRSATGLVDGHKFNGNKHSARLAELVNGLRAAGEDPWLPGEAEEKVPERYYQKFGSLPEAWQYENTAGLTREKQLLDRGWVTGGFSQTKYWPWDKPGKVISGAGPHQVWHPDMRQITHRETARIMGFPDDWRIEPLQNDKALYSYWGKGTSVAPARFICGWIRESLDGNPGSTIGELQDDGSRLIDVSQHWRLVEQRLTSPAVQLPVPAPRLAKPAVAATRESLSRKPTVTPATKIPQVSAAPVVLKSPAPQKPSLAWQLSVPPGFSYQAEDEAAVKAVFSQCIYGSLNIRPGDRVLDLGAHVGSFTVLACQHGASHVTAVEMIPATTATLAQNITGMPVDVIAGAVTAEATATGRAAAVTGSRASRMRSFVLGDAKSKVSQTAHQASVMALPFAELLEQSRPAIIKFSLEGGEGRVLTSHAQLMASAGVRQVIGYHYTHDERFLSQAQALHAALKSAGYRPSRLAPQKVNGWGTMICYTLVTGKERRRN